MAYAELRLVVAKMIFNFDFVIDERCEGWEERIEHHTLFGRPELWVKLVPVGES